MTAKDILKIVCVFLKKEDFLETQSFGGTTQPTNSQTKEINHMLRCLNLVVNQISSDYIPLLKKETITPTNGKVLLGDLSKTVIDVIRVEDKFGIRVNYKMFPDYFETINGEINVLYSYEPAEVSELSSEIESFSQKIGERVIAYGVAMEYCFICGLHDDDKKKEKRFKDALLIASRKKGEIKLPKRRWS